MKLEEIQDLIKFVSKSGVTCVEIEQKDFKIVIKTVEKEPKQKKTTVTVPQQVAIAPAPQAAAIPVAPPAAAAPAPASAPPATAAAENSKYITVNSPMIGTFYRSPGPDKPVFIGVGDDIKAGKVICIIEAMKLFNEIEAEISGKVVKILVDDATPVEYDQPLFLVDPS